MNKRKQKEDEKRAEGGRGEREGGDLSAHLGCLLQEHISIPLGFLTL